MTAHTSERDVVEAARHLYEAEVALHAAHQTAVDAWIAAASEGLHKAVVAHTRAVARATLAPSLCAGPVPTAAIPLFDDRVDQLPGSDSVEHPQFTRVA